MDHAASNHASEVVALLCPELRLNRLLRMALEADGFGVRDWPLTQRPASHGVRAIVADLDSLGWSPDSADEGLAAIGFPTDVARLLISVLPSETVHRGASNVAYLQPPFSPREFVRGLHTLLNL